MRTTVSLEERLAERVERKAASEGLSASEFVAKTLDDALKRAAPPFRLVTVKGGGLQSGVSLDRPNALVMADDQQAFER